MTENRRRNDERILELLAANAELMRVLQEHIKKDDVLQENVLRFQNRYGAYLDLSLERERDRAAIRKAVLERLLTAGIWSLVLGLATLLFLGAKEWIVTLR